MTVVVVCLTLALLTALGWIFWQNFVYKTEPQKDTELLVVDKPASKDDSIKADENDKSINLNENTKTDDDNKPTSPNSNEGYLPVTQWGIRIKTSVASKLSYKLDRDAILLFGKFSQTPGCDNNMLGIDIVRGKSRAEGSRSSATLGGYTYSVRGPQGGLCTDNTGNTAPGYKENLDKLVSDLTALKIEAL